jgi:hypothetical protein
VLVRGDLVRRYPSVAFMLLSPLAGEPPVEDGEILADHVTLPSFRTLLDVNTVVVGFPKDPREVLGEGWYVCLEEPFTQPRAGLDESVPGDDYDAPPASWADLSWGHLGDAGFVSAAALDGLELGGLTWGRNSAHMAGITFQQPFRFIVPAVDLIGAAK